MLEDVQNRPGDATRILSHDSRFAWFSTAAANDDCTYNCAAFAAVGCRYLPGSQHASELAVPAIGNAR
jgi:hypothetical protein